MNTQTGEIVGWNHVQAMQPEEQKKHVPIARAISDLEHAQKQLLLYSPCGCGSGKNFKFCCNKP